MQFICLVAQINYMYCYPGNLQVFTWAIDRLWPDRNIAVSTDSDAAKSVIEHLTHKDHVYVDSGSVGTILGAIYCVHRRSHENQA